MKRHWCVIGTLLVAACTAVPDGMEEAEVVEPEAIPSTPDRIPDRVEIAPAGRPALDPESDRIRPGKEPKCDAELMLGALTDSEDPPRFSCEPACDDIGVVDACVHDPEGCPLFGGG